MFRLSLALRKIDENEMVLSLPKGFRLMFAAIVIFLVASMISTGGVSAGSVVLTVLSCLAGLYKEQWRFLKEAEVVEHQSGLLFPYVTKRTPFAEIETFVLSYSKTWRPSVSRKKEDFDNVVQSQKRGTSMTSFGLLTKDGKAQTIEIRKSRTNEIMEDNVQQISDFCEIPVKFQE